MEKAEVRNLLIVGVDTVFVAASAKKASYNVYVADYFGDADLQRACHDFMAAIEQQEGKSCGRMTWNFKPEVFLEMAKNLSKKHTIDGILLSSGLDDYFDILYELNSLAPIIGNDPKVFRDIREKPRFFDELEVLGIPHPETEVAKGIFEAKESVSRIGFPVVLKPTESFGGANIRLVKSQKELEKVLPIISRTSESVVIQKFVEGVHASISILAGEKGVRVLSINEQLLGLNPVFQHEPFGYCGNVVPLRVEGTIFEKCEAIAGKIASHFSLLGSNGIDIVISKSRVPYVIEVNPRFQGTLGCIEKVLGINIVESHINACLYGELPTVRSPSKFCTRLILYAPKRIFAPNLATFKETWDIPLPNSIIEEGEPLCSILTEGKSRSSSLRKAERLAKLIYGKLREA
ncbi:MAG: ATP-grasp domain-containing protein [Candidatus Bathyarchaeales archaeon]